MTDVFARKEKAISPHLKLGGPPTGPEQRLMLWCDGPQEVFYLTYTPEDVEGTIHVDTGDKVSFYMETNKQ